MRVIFFTDLHGSTLVFEKGLALARDYEVDLIILGGDLSGKRMLPIEKSSSGNFIAHEPYKKKDDSGKATIVYEKRQLQSAELPRFLRKLEAKGYYWYVGGKEEIHHINSVPAELARLERAAITQRLKDWATLANDRMSEGVECVWTGGNDDDQEVLDHLRDHSLGRFVYGEDRLHEFGGYQILSLGVSNPTPFDTAREYQEHEITTMLERWEGDVKNTDMLLLNIHVPPSSCGDLDLVVDIEDPDRLIHVGSTAVRNFIEKLEPLADFAGHIHERSGAAKIGRTMIFNPGSDYNSGILRAFVVSLDGASLRSYVHLLR
jgi:Icc-related predicted phosphoesterase